MTGHTDLPLKAMLLMLPLVVAFERAALPAAALALVALGACVWRAGRPWLRPLRGAALGLLGFAAVGVAVSPVPEVSLLQVARLFFGVALALMLAESRLRAPHKWRATAVLLAGLALAAPWVTDWVNDKILLPDVYRYFPRLPIDGAHPNVMGGWLAIGLPFAVTGGRQLRGWPRAGWVMLACLLAALLLLTQARAAWIAAGLGVGGLMLAWLPMRARVAALATGSVLGALVLSQSAVLPRLLYSPNGPPNQPASSALEKRIELWERGASLLRAQPWTGIGFGAFAARNQDFEFRRNLPGIPHVHQLALQVALDVGLPGLAAWLMLVLAALRRAWRAARGGDTWAAAAVAALGVMLMHGAADAVSWGMVRPAVLGWALLGAMMAEPETGPAL